MDESVTYPSSRWPKKLWHFAFIGMGEPIVISKRPIVDCWSEDELPAACSGLNGQTQIN